MRTPTWILTALLAACGAPPMSELDGSTTVSMPDGGADDAGLGADAGARVDAGPSDDAGAGADDGGASSDAGTGTDGGTTGDAGASTDGGPTSDAGARLDAGSSADGGPTSDAGASLDACASADSAVADAGAVPDAGCLFETFDAIADGGAWPSAWTVAGGVSSFAVHAGAGSWSPVLSMQPYSLGRLTHPGCGATALDVRFSAWLPPNSGLGFYVRSNGGFLVPRATTPGAGYAIFLETFRDRSFGLWRERAGVEFELRPVLGVTPSSTWVKARFQVRQVPLPDGGASSSTTLLRGHVWTPTAPEPTSWTEITDSSPELQAGASGSRLAIDSFNELTAGQDAGVRVFIDDLEVLRL